MDDTLINDAEAFCELDHRVTKFVGSVPIIRELIAALKDARTQDNTLLVNAIDAWMKADTGNDERYAHGYAHGIARALSVLRSTDFTTQWELGLDGYQRLVCGQQ